MAQKYRRVILKLSGEALCEEARVVPVSEVDDAAHALARGDKVKAATAKLRLFAQDRFDAAARMLADVRKSGTQLAVVIGAGNVWRGRRDDAAAMGTVAADQMGMLGTLQNCLCMQDALRRLGEKSVVMSAVDIPRFAESYQTVKALEHLEAGKIVLLACGLGNPCFSTDSAVVLRAIELECDVILMAKNINGVYTADPNRPETRDTARLIPEITYAEALERDLRVMDAAAFIMLKENAFPLVRVYALNPAENTPRVLSGDTMGTILHP